MSLRTSAMALCLAVLVLWISSPALAEQATVAESRAAADVAAQATDKPVLTDQLIAGYQSELLEMAINASTAIPIQPHIKDRSRAQESVVGACLALNQPAMADRYANRIQNWRRGVAYADIAFYLARQGRGEQTPYYLKRAESISQAEGLEGWRRDRIRAKLGMVHALLGHEQEAARMDANLSPSEAGKRAIGQAMVLSKDDLAAELKRLDAIVATGDFDTTRNALAVYEQLYDRFCDQADERSVIEQKVTVAVRKVAIPVQIETWMSLAEASLTHGESDLALRHIDQGRELIEQAKCAPEDTVAIIAKLAALRYRAGETKEAIAEAEGAWELFNTRIEEIMGIFRAGALCPLAEAYLAMGERAKADMVYLRAVEEGADNPNGRPRALDLTATCLSMARAGYEPNPDLMSRMRQLQGELGQPW